MTEQERNYWTDESVLPVTETDPIQRLRLKAQQRSQQARLKNPAIAKREHEVFMVREVKPALICPMCDGYSLRMDEQCCQNCGGMGFVCPFCRGARLVKLKRHKDDSGPEVAYCPACMPQGTYVAEREMDSIRYWVEYAKHAAAARVEQADAS